MVRAPTFPSHSASGFLSPMVTGQLSAAPVTVAALGETKKKVLDEPAPRCRV